MYPTRADLTDALRQQIEAGIQLEGASDHGVSEAIYLRDPDGNGMELYWDRPKEQMARTSSGELAMHTLSLDLQAILKKTPDVSTRQDHTSGAHSNAGPVQ